MASHETQVMWRGFNAYPDVAKAINKDLLFSLMNQALIIVSKFLEVWDDFGSLAKPDPRVIPARRAFQPIIDRIRIWQGLDLFRNTTLAHPYTTKNGQLLPPWELTSRGLAPTYHAEQILLLQLVTFAEAGLLSVFEAEFRGIEPLCGPTGPTPGPGIAKGAEIEGVLRPMLQEVDQKLKSECGVVVKADIVKAFKKAIGR